MDQLPDLGYEDEPVEHVKVAVTTFAFPNSEIINLLVQRGNLIKDEKWNDLQAIDAKINQLKNEHLEELTTPCSVFMTFENEEGVNRALSYNDAIGANEDLSHLGLWLDSHEIEIQPASEPSDIIWENRHFTPAQRLKKSCIAWAVILKLLSISFVLIFLCSQYSVKMLSKYPVVDCANLTSL